MPSPTFSLPRPSKPLRRAVAVAIATAGLFVLGGCPQKEAAVGAAPEASPTPASAALPPAARTAPAPRPTVSATLKRAELLALVFPDSQGPQAAADTPDTVRLPEIGNDGKQVAGSDGERKAQVSAREVVRLDDRHAVMLTENLPLDDQGQPMNGHPEGAWLGAYFFEQGPDGWKLTGRNDAVDYQGFMGNLGETKVEHLTTGQFVMTLTNGSCWQGNCAQWLSVFSLETDRVRAMVRGIPLSAVNEGADEACEKLLKAERPEAPPRNACYDISGRLAFAPGAEGDEKGEMHIAFSGKRTNGTKDPAVRTVNTTLVYVNRNGAYVLRQGRNPVPSF
ncbi:hypothetical protein ACSFA7_02755 [Variovorax sp. LT1R20]|uniref:hypothetical protein n=1 Tax=Variovorax sp. LT1R20 TaxID=3443729 RepID=UPI003F48DB28